MSSGRRRVLPSVSLVGRTVLMTDLAAIAVNEAIAQPRSPWWLHGLKQHPWRWTGVLTAVAAVLALVAWWRDRSAVNARISGAGGVPQAMRIRWRGTGRQVGRGRFVERPTVYVKNIPVASKQARLAPLAEPSGPAGKQVVVGEIPSKPVAWQARPDLANQLAVLAEGGGPAVVCAVTGIHGVGMTHVAAAYARARVAEGWPLVAWVVAESRGQLLSGLDELASRVGVRPADGDSGVAAQAAKEYLRGCRYRSLLVLDNVTDVDMVAEWLPDRGRCQVVITSARRGVESLGRPVVVDRFSDVQAVAYLQERTGLADDLGAMRVAGEVGHLPLALAQAAPVIARQHLSFALYLQRLKAFPLDEYLRRLPGDPYARGASAAIALAVHEVESQEGDGVTSRLLELLAVLSPAGVDRQILYAAAPFLTSQADGTKPASLASVDSALGVLDELSMVSFSVGDRAVIVHRLTGRVVRDRTARRDRVACVVHAAASALRECEIPHAQAWQHRQAGAHLVEQVNALWDSLTAAQIPPEQYAGVAGLVIERRMWTVLHLMTVEDLARAIEAARELVADCAGVLGPDHPDTLSLRDTLAQAYASSRRLTKAMTLHDQNFADRLRVLGPDHPDTLTSRDHQAVAYILSRRPAEAITLLERNLADRLRVLGPDHLDTLTSRDHLALAYGAIGRQAEEITLLELNLVDRLRVLGPDHRGTVGSRHDLAIAYEHVGRRGEAVALLEQNLADRIRVLGSDHPDTLASRHSLALSYQRAGRRIVATRLLKQNLAERLRVLGSDHPDTLASRHSLALSYVSTLRWITATKLLNQNLAERLRVLGPDHSDTLASRRSLGYPEEGN